MLLGLYSSEMITLRSPLSLFPVMKRQLQYSMDLKLALRLVLLHFAGYYRENGGAGEARVKMILHEREIVCLFVSIFLNHCFFLHSQFFLMLFEN